jgi:hypothetical protein
MTRKASGAGMNIFTLEVIVGRQKEVHVHTADN